MAVVSSGTVITTTPFGAALSNTAASLNPYNVFAVTIAVTHSLTGTVPFVRGYNSNYFITWPGGWHTIYLQMSNGVFSASFSLFLPFSLSLFSASAELKPFSVVLRSLSVSSVFSK